MEKMRSAQLCVCLVVLTAASCGFPRLSEIADGGGGSDGPTGDGGPPPYGLELLAGNIGGPGNADGIGTAARFNGIGGVTVDSAGNVFAADYVNSTIRKVTAAGVVTTLAGTAGMYGSTDDTGAAARFYHPGNVAVDSAGNVYAADTLNYTIRKVTPAGVVTTLTGTAGMRGSVDGTGAAARFNGPGGVAVDGAGNIYVTDNQTIRKITIAGVVTTLAGSAGMSGSTDGTGAAARFNNPGGVTVDSASNIYVADAGNNTIRKVTAVGLVTTLAGTAGMSGSTDGTGAVARFSYPIGAAVDSGGNIYVADQATTIRKITASGVVTTLAGTAGQFGSADGTGAAARFDNPGEVTVDSAGNVYVADGPNTIRKVTAAGVVTTLAGASDMFGGADGTGAAARFALPTSVAVDSAGNVYVADINNHTVRKITTAGVVTTLATPFGLPAGVAVDSAGTVYVTDGIIQKVTADGVLTTLAGTSGISGSADGTSAAARFNLPSGVAVDSAGTVYVADQNNSTIRKITAVGVVTTLAGIAGMYGSADGTGAAARFSYPHGVAVDSAGNVYVADGNNSTIRKITAAGVVTTLAGTAGMDGIADGTGAAARFGNPAGVAVDSASNVYVVDTFNSTIRKITPAGTTTTVAGTAGVAGILLGATPRFAFPQSLAIVGDSIVLCDTNAILLLRHGAQ